MNHDYKEATRKLTDYNNCMLKINNDRLSKGKVCVPPKCRGETCHGFNKKRNQVKRLSWEGDGLSLHYKRLEQVTYECSQNRWLLVAKQEFLVI